MNPTKTRIQNHQPHWNGSGYTLSAPWRGSPKDLPAGCRDKPENVGAASRRNTSKCVLLIIRNLPPNRHGHTTQKSVSHTELQGPSCSLQKTRLQEQKNIYSIYIQICLANHSSHPAAKICNVGSYINIIYIYISTKTYTDMRC